MHKCPGYCRTCANASLSETMIAELEESGMRLHTEKQEYVGRLQVEADSLRKQIDRNQVRVVYQRQLRPRGCGTSALKFSNDFIRL